MGIIKNKIRNSKFEIQNKSFTLIEMIVVVAVIGLALPAMFSIIFTIISAQVKVYQMQQVKKEGDLIMRTIETKIKTDSRGIFSDATLLTQKCHTSASPSYSSSTGAFYFKNAQGHRFNYYLDTSTGQIAFYDQDAATQTINLSSAKVYFAPGSFVLSCSFINSYTPPTVNVNFTICYRKAGGCDANSLLPYNNLIKLKNY